MQEEIQIIGENPIATTEPSKPVKFYRHHFIDTNAEGKQEHVFTCFISRLRWKFKVENMTPEFLEEWSGIRLSNWLLGDNGKFASMFHFFKPDVLQ